MIEKARRTLEPRASPASRKLIFSAQAIIRIRGQISSFILVAWSLFPRRRRYRAAFEITDILKYERVELLANA